MSFLRSEKGSAAKGLALIVGAITMVAIMVSGGPPGETGPTDITDTAAVAPTGITRNQQQVANSCHGNVIAKLIHAGFGCEPEVNEDSVVFLRGDTHDN